MSFTTVSKKQARRLKGAIERMWSWHHYHMQAGGRYARTVIQGVVRAIWQPTVGRGLAVLAIVIAEVLRALSEDGFAIDEGLLD